MSEQIKDGTIPKRHRNPKRVKPLGNEPVSIPYNKEVSSAIGSLAREGNAPNHGTPMRSQYLYRATAEGVCSTEMLHGIDFCVD